MEEPTKKKKLWFDLTDKSIKKKKPWYEQWWPVTLMVIIGLVIAGNVIGGGDKEKAATAIRDSTIASSSLETKVMEIPPSINAKTLYREYEADAVKADLKYKDKVYIIFGFIGSIKKDITKTTNILIGENGDICLMIVHDTDFANLKAGDSITVKGKIIGFVTKVAIADCELIEQR
ncbi:MAG: hypothetical protein PHD83_01765 [Caldisericia bacterium]|nr:hypothetical protein [Caldisericia bacterium]